MAALQFPDPPLADEVVRLRPWTDLDLEPALQASHDPLVPLFTRVPEDQTERQLREYLDSHEQALADGTRLPLVVADPGSDGFLGSIALMRIDWPEHRGEVGYWLASKARGRGVATHAVRLLSRWALLDLGLARLALYTDPDNSASQGVAERCGFTREGVLRSYQEDKGRRRDQIVFSLLPGDV